MNNSQFVFILTILLLTTISAQFDEDPVSSVTSPINSFAKYDNFRKGGLRKLNVTSSNNIRLYAEQFGDSKDPTVIFISEFMQSRLVWAPQLISKQFTEDLHLVFYDARGILDSDKPRDVNFYNNVSFVADDLNAVITAATNQYPNKKVTIVGWSYGMDITLLYVQKYGQSKLNGVVSVCYALNDEDFSAAILESVSSSVNLTYEDMIEVRDYLIRNFTGEGLPPLEETTRLVFLGGSIFTPSAYISGSLSSEFNIVETYTSLTIPILIISGAKDVATNPRAANFALEKAKNGTVIVFENSGHIPFWEETKKFNEVVRKFVLNVNK
ncbi:1924_t:CDS:2 [Ambispora leptoticha]|uniref:1924_t:CDS:1 n=1 Tax=Ambispora leptoticha TaxID=144679 RepID=A0A9N8YL80_9GLOM|nr:1924_t:CDS:2 [Ambispora leptoticha]